MSLGLLKWFFTEKTMVDVYRCRLTSIDILQKREKLSYLAEEVVGFGGGDADGEEVAGSDCLIV